MARSNKDKLMKEYAKRFLTTFRILELTGFCRFIIRNGKIVERSFASVLYNIFIVIMGDVGAMIILWTANLSEQTLSTVEFATIVHFAIFSNVLLFHITFGDKYRGPDLIQNCIELDDFLGPEETEFMRILADRFYKVLVIMVGFSQVVIVSYMYYVFHVPLIIHVVGTTYFFWIVFAYDDFCFFVYSFLFLTMRARYINVALLKVSKMNMEYLPRQFMFHKLFWRNGYDERVTFHNRIKDKSFSIAFRMLFHQLRHVERCYRFPVTLGVFTVMMGSFVTVQTFIMYTESSQGITRAGVITGWAVASWFYILAMSILPDMFYRQIQQSKIICAYIQLKPSSSPEMLKLTKDVISTLEIRDEKLSLYDVFYFDISLVFKLAVSTFVYMTVQLQLAFPNIEEGHKTENVTTTPTFVLDRKTVKEFLFL